ncbi:MAG: 4Fe-4S dicluster domain-containing protein [Nitrospirales bacterium]|nr:4Fe-4S dicluster domain-containing protein [Nitrospirales bacterium]
MALASSEDAQKRQDFSPSRRNFIKQSVVSLGLTVREYVHHRNAPAEKKTGTTEIIEKKNWLRPPGAVEEQEFLERCTSCGDCVSACPYGSIREQEPDYTPVIFADESPCYVCKDLPCIRACETDALLPLDDVSQVKMGLAVVSPQRCTAEQGCHTCVSKCPTQALDMDFSNFRLAVAENRCVGCGVCEHVCKTVNDRVAIVVIPLMPSTE